MAEAVDLNPTQCGFESHSSDHAGIAQLEERHSCKVDATGSIPVTGSSSGCVVQRQRHSAQTRDSVGSNPTAPTTCLRDAMVA